MIIAHRGRLRLNQPTENTLADFQSVIDINVDGIETDLRITKCNRVVIFHDDHIKNKKIKDLFLYEILALNENIPTLSEFMDLMQHNQEWKGLINLEIKTFGQTEFIVNILKNYPKLLDRIMVSSFLHPAVWELKKKLPQIQTGLVYRCYPTTFNIHHHKKPDYVILYKETVVDNPNFEKLTKKCKFHMIKLLVYTIKDVNEAKRYSNFHGIIADCSQNCSAAQML